MVEPTSSGSTAPAGSTGEDATSGSTSAASTDASTEVGPDTTDAGTEVGPDTTDAGTEVGSDTTDADPSSTGEAPITCATYCEVYLVKCVDYSEYDSLQQCLDQCSQWPIGELGATEGDSLHCRAYYASGAQRDPFIKCPPAGPSGDGVCADPNAPSCADYCGAYFGNCMDGLNVYTDMNDCTDQCGRWYPGTNGDVVGDTVGCRLYHAGVAIGDPVVHCPHAGPGGAEVCVVTM